MAQFDFRDTFDKIGRIFVQGLSKRVKQQTGIDGSGYSKPAESTLRSRRAKKSAKTGKVLTSSASTKRLWVTGEFGNEAFGYTPKANGVKVFVREVSHKLGISYAQILRHNSRGQRELNRNIASPPLVFPVNASEVMLMTDEMEKAKRIFAIEANKQLREKAKMNIKVQLKIG